MQYNIKICADMTCIQKGFDRRIFFVTRFFSIIIIIIIIRYNFVHIDNSGLTCARTHTHTHTKNALFCSGLAAATRFNNNNKNLRYFRHRRTQLITFDRKIIRSVLMVGYAKRYTGLSGEGRGGGDTNPITAI